MSKQFFVTYQTDEPGCCGIDRTGFAASIKTAKSYIKRVRNDERKAKWNPRNFCIRDCWGKYNENCSEDDYPAFGYPVVYREA